MTAALSFKDELQRILVVQYQVFTPVNSKVEISKGTTGGIV